MGTFLCIPSWKLWKISEHTPSSKLPQKDFHMSSCTGNVNLPGKSESYSPCINHRNHKNPVTFTETLFDIYLLLKLQNTNSSRAWPKVLTQHVPEVHIYLRQELHTHVVIQERAQQAVVRVGGCRVAVHAPSPPLVGLAQGGNAAQNSAVHLVTSRQVNWWKRGGRGGVAQPIQGCRGTYN